MKNALKREDEARTYKIRKRKCRIMGTTKPAGSEDTLNGRK